MSKISYCSLDEAWEPFIGQSQINQNKSQNAQDYQPQRPKMQTEEERQNVIQKMNSIERNTRFSNDETPQWKGDPEYNSSYQNQTHKKYLEDKLAFLELELQKYKKIELEHENEHFQSEITSSSPSQISPKNDIIDLILLIMIGLILIFIMHSIFMTGILIGERKR